MRGHLANRKKNIKTIALVIIFFAIVFLSGCTKELDSNLVICNLDDYSLYPKVLEQILPSFKIEESESKPYYFLNDGASVEAFDTQAAGAIEAGLAKYWYPQYLATAIIAVDRDQTDVIVTDWSDLFATQLEIGFFDTPGNIQMLTAAMSYGLEGEDYSLTKAIGLLTSLHEDKRLKINSFDSPLIICFDYQAVNLIKNGRNLEIIVPREGTYSYEKGLLSNEILNFQGNLEKLLLGADLPLLEGENNLPSYPRETAYASAARVMDYEHFAKTTQNVNSVIEREVLNSRKYMSISNQEHLYSALVYIIIVTIWVASVLRRSMQKGMSYAAFFTGVILNLWTLVRLIKYQVEAIPILSRYLWYSFYIFQLSLPLVLLWMAWAIDKSENEIIPPMWLRKIAVLIGFLIIVVFTNDLHGLVLKLDLTRADWAINYTYGFAYYVILFVSMMNLLAVLLILVKKGIKNTRKKGFIFPIFILILFGIYNYKYIMRDPFIYKTDITIITGLFTMLMFESCIWAGLIPVNTRYIDLFTRSPLKMQIINNKREIALASSSAVPLDRNILDKIIESSPSPILQDESLLFANPIPGGYAIWNEDVSQLYQLHKEVQEATKMLTEANLILAEEKKTKLSINEKAAKKQLMDQLETEIEKSIKKLTTMIEKLPKSEDHSKDTTRIALLLCYIKRRCNLFFHEKKTNIMDGDELILYINELSEITNLSDVQIGTISEIVGNIPTRYAILFYDFSYSVADLAVQKNFSSSIQHLGIKDNFFTMGFLPSEKVDNFHLEHRLVDAIKGAKGKIVIKDLEETTGISISFPKGGERNG